MSVRPAHAPRTADPVAPLEEIDGDRDSPADETHPDDKGNDQRNSIDLPVMWGVWRGMFTSHPPSVLVGIEIPMRIDPRHVSMVGRESEFGLSRLR